MERYRMKRFRMKRHWACMALCVALGCGEGTDGGPSTVTVSGKVREDALAFKSSVTVKVMTAGGQETGYETTSDSAGCFAVTAPARSEVYFRCTALGCVPTNSRIVATGKTALEDVELWIFTLGARTDAASGVASATGVTADITGRGLVVGLLYDQDGYPVTGARVTISTADPDPDTGTGLAYRDFDGAYGILPFTIGLIPTHQFAAVNVPDSAATDVFELTQDVGSASARARSVAGEVTAVVLRGLPVYCAVIGAVIKETETGVSGATVEAYDASGALLAETSSDDEGAFVITRLTKGTEFYIHAEKTAAGRVPGNTRYYTIGDEPLIGTGVLLVSDTYYDGLLEEMRLDLGFTRDDSKALLGARLTDTNDPPKPIAGETVTMTPVSGERGYVDSDGSFDDAGVGVHDGNDYTDTQAATSLVQWVAANVDTGGTVDVSQSVDDTVYKLPCRSGEVTGVGFEDLPRRVRIRGVVRDEQGTVLPGALVSIYNDASINDTTDGAGRFQLGANPGDRILAGSRVALKVELATYKTTNTPYIDLSDSDTVVGDIVIMTTGYYDTLVSEIEAANAGLTVDDTTCGVIVGAVRDVQRWPGPGKVDGAEITQSPSSGLLDYVYDDAGADKFGGSTVTETDDQVAGLVMFMAVNVDPVVEPESVTLTEDWDGTSLDCPVRAGEVTLAAFTDLTPQNTVWGLVCENNSFRRVFFPPGSQNPVEGAEVEAYDIEGALLGSDTSDASGAWEIKGIRAFARLYLSVSMSGSVTTNTPYYDIEYTDALICPALYTLGFVAQLEDKWDDVNPVPDTITCGVVTGDLASGEPFFGITKIADETASLSDPAVQVGYMDDLGDFALASTHADPQLFGEGAPQFSMFDVEPGDYILEQSADGKMTRVPVLAGEYTHVCVAGIEPVAGNRTVDMSGTITDGTNPVAGAVVRIPDSPYSTVTAADGSYTLSNVPDRSRITVSVSRDGATINIPYFEAYATGALDLFFLDPMILDLLTMRFEAELGELDPENKALVLGMVENADGPVEGVTVSLTPPSGDTAYFDEYMRAVAPYTQEESGLQFVIGNIEPGDAVLTQDYNWQRVELPCRAGEWTLGFMGLSN